MDDCQKWAGHAVRVIVDDWMDAASKCPPSVRDPIVGKIDGQRTVMNKAAVDVCSKHIGESLPAEGAPCYMAATTAKGLADCKLAPMTNPADIDLPAQLAALRANCAQMPKAPPGLSSRPRPTASSR
jgi:hypothetical protein